MNQKAFPQSVRKRRRRIMYHYVIVCIMCWTPTMVFYIAEIAGLHSAALEIVARGSLYLTGFFNFLVFGMQVSIMVIYNDLEEAIPLGGWSVIGH